MKLRTIWHAAEVTFFLLSTHGSLAAPKAVHPFRVPVVTITQITYHGWRNCCLISSGHVRAVIVPEIGGRIMEYSRDGENIIYQNPAEWGKVYPLTKIWHNYGGFKNWNAPQSAWGWPPDPFLDYGPASLQILNAGARSPTVEVTGAVSLQAGLLFVRDISMNPSTGDLSLRQRLLNISRKDQKWSTWDITQVTGNCIVVIPLNPKSAYPGGYYGDTTTKRTWTPAWHQRSNLLIARRNGNPDKVYADPSAGWMACFRGRLAYIKRIPARQTGAVYPDKGSNAEVWLNGNPLSYIEMEILSPINPLPHGASGELSEQWQLRTLRHPVRTDADIAAAVRAIHLPP